MRQSDSIVGRLAGVRGKGVRSHTREAVVAQKGKETRSRAWLIPVLRLFLVPCGHLIPTMRTNGRKGWGPRR